MRKFAALYRRTRSSQRYNQTNPAPVIKVRSVCLLPPIEQHRLARRPIHSTLHALCGMSVHCRRRAVVHIHTTAYRLSVRTSAHVAADMDADFIVCPPLGQPGMTKLRVLAYRCRHRLRRPFRARSAVRRNPAGKDVPVVPGPGAQSLPAVVNRKRAADWWPEPV